MPKQQPFDALIKFRCFKELVARMMRLAERNRRDYADMLRIAMEDYAEDQEKSLKLGPITNSEVAFYFTASQGKARRLGKGQWARDPTGHKERSIARSESSKTRLAQREKT